VINYLSRTFSNRCS